MTKRKSLYVRWLEDMATNRLTLEQIRCDIPPNDVVLLLMDKWGLDRWEQFSDRLQSSVCEEESANG